MNLHNAVDYFANFVNNQKNLNNLNFKNKLATGLK